MMTVNTIGAFDATRRWQLSENVSFREEAFGALAYHHVNRRLVFLKSPQLVELVSRLGAFESAEAAINELIDVKGRLKYVEALASLAKSEILDER